MKNEINNAISNGVMLNAYPDSVGNKLSDIISLLKKPELKDVFSLFYVLPTFFNSDLDRGFSIIDYNLNETLVSEEDLKALDDLNIMLKFDIVLNHLSVASMQFKDLLQNGNQSKYKDFFINWNMFWKGNGELDQNGIIIPKKEYLDKLFMRKAGLPILKVRLPDGTEQPYWNTFYQDVSYQDITVSDLSHLQEIHEIEAQAICVEVNNAIKNKLDFNELELLNINHFSKEIINVIEKKKTYLGQMDVNAASELVWEFYEETLAKLKGFGCKILRLDAFAYLHKEVGESNFFNKPGTWDYLDRIKQIAIKKDLMLLPEIHAEYGEGVHDEVAKKGYFIYDFFLPGLVIHTLENGNNKALLNWAKEIVTKGYKTVNMLGCHDGIPVLDLKGKEVNGIYNKGLLDDSEIDAIMNTIMDRGGIVKNLFDAEGNKVSYYQINATYFSALGENENKLLLARAIQLFMPGIPQVWYLDLFVGKNNYDATDKIGSGSHKEINRTNLSIREIEEGLKTEIVLNQLELLRIRNTSKAFSGKLRINESIDNIIDLNWSYFDDYAHLQANLSTLSFTINYTELGVEKVIKF